LFIKDHYEKFYKLFQERKIDERWILSLRLDFYTGRKDRSGRGECGRPDSR